MHIEKKHHHTLTPYLKMRLHQIAIDLKGRGRNDKKKESKICLSMLTIPPIFQENLSV